MRKNILVVMLVAVITLLNAFCFAEEVSVTGSLNEAVSALEGGSISLVSPSQTVPSDATIRVQLDGNYLDFTDENGNVVNPQIINNRTMVPMRKIFETFNAKVNWEESTKTVTATTSEKEITLVINDAKAKVKDVATGVESTITLDQVALIKNNRTLVPVRFIAESLNQNVGWDNNARTVVIIDYNKLTKELENKVPALQKLFAMNIQNIESFKSTSTLNGTISYKDNAAEQYLNIKGTAKVASNKSEDMEGDVTLSVTGSDIGEISSAVKENGLDNFNAKIVLKGDKMYFGILQDGKYNWTDASSSLSTVNNVSVAYNVDKINSYSAVMDFIKSTVGEANSNTYAMLKAVIDAFGKILSNESVVVTENGTQKTLEIKLDAGSLMKAFGAEDQDLGLLFTLKLVVNDGKIQSESMKIDGDFAVNGETLALDIAVDSVYDELNSDFTIEAPAM